MAWAKFGLNRERSGQARRRILWNPRIGLHDYHHDFLSRGDIVRIVDTDGEVYSADRSSESFAICAPKRVSTAQLQELSGELCACRSGGELS